MGRKWLRGGAGVALACGVAAAVVGTPARAVNDDLTIFSQFLSIDGSTGIGAGGDGSLVLMTASYSFVPPEDPILLEDLVDKPYLYYNPDLFSWAPGQDHLQQFTATGIVENEDGDALLWGTENREPAVFTRTGDGRSPADTRVFAVAYSTNADPAVDQIGPVSTITEISDTFQVLGSNGRVIVYRDSSLPFSVPLVAVPHFQECYEPSVAFRTRVVNRGSSKPGNFRTIEISEAWVAFSGTADNNQDNSDGNYEIHVWSRSAFLASGGEVGFLNSNGVVQLTHTTSGDCWSPSVNIHGDVAFVSDADITGDNPDGSSEIFVWRRRRDEIRQITSIASGRYVDSPCWGDNGRKLVFEGDANITGENSDLTGEIFMWNGRAIFQCTSGTTGDSWSPSMDPQGQMIAFLTDADLSNVVYGATPRPEIVVTNGKSRRYRQVTQVNDVETNEAPTLTRSRSGRTHVTFVSSSNLDGRNSNNNRRIYRAKVR